MCSYRSRRRMTADAWRPALCANADVPTYGCCGFGVRLRLLGHVVGHLGQTAELLLRDDRDALLQDEVRGDRREVRVAATLAVPVHHALDVHDAGVDRGERVRDGAVGVVVAVDPEGVVDRAPHLTSTISVISFGRHPPFVSQSTRQSAPFSAAASSTRIAYCGVRS